MTTPHKHAEVIKAWADGAEIQWQCPRGEWKDCLNNLPAWKEGVTYRVKPPREFPKTTMSGLNLWKEYYRASGYSGTEVEEAVAMSMGSTGEALMKAVANAAIKQYILDQEAAK